jgi:hypothetical protein
VSPRLGIRLVQTPPVDSETQPLLTIDEAYRAAYHFILQYYRREPIEPLVLLLASMREWGGAGSDPRSTADPATWSDWVQSVERARASAELPRR